jgi:hypothetical protein
MSSGLYDLAITVNCDRAAVWHYTLAVGCSWVRVTASGPPPGAKETETEWLGNLKVMFKMASTMLFSVGIPVRDPPTVAVGGPDCLSSLSADRIALSWKDSAQGTAGPIAQPPPQLTMPLVEDTGPDAELLPFYADRGSYSGDPRCTSVDSQVGLLGPVYADSPRHASSTGGKPSHGADQRLVSYPEAYTGARRGERIVVATNEMPSGGATPSRVAPGGATPSRVAPGGVLTGRPYNSKIDKLVIQLRARINSGQIPPDFGANTKSGIAKAYNFIRSASGETGLGFDILEEVRLRLQ